MCTEMWQCPFIRPSFRNIVLMYLMHIIWVSLRKKKIFDHTFTIFEISIKTIFGNGKHTVNWIYCVADEYYTPIVWFWLHFIIRVVQDHRFSCIIRMNPGNISLFSLYTEKGSDSVHSFSSISYFALRPSFFMCRISIIIIMYVMYVHTDVYPYQLPSSTMVGNLGSNWHFS